MNRCPRITLTAVLVSFLLLDSSPIRGSEEPAAALPSLGGEPFAAFRTVGNGWTNTSSGTSSLGTPAQLTWSMALDGTTLPTSLGEPNNPSNLVTFLDSIHGGLSPGGPDLTQRVWFPLVQSSFARWDQVSGITFNYEPNDDGAAFSPAYPGVLGTRGDHRLGGHSIDGQTSPTFLAYSFFSQFL